MYCRIVAALVFILGTTPCAFSDAQSDAIREVIARHRAAIESIHTLYCMHWGKHEYADGRVSATPTSEYWRKGETVRCKWRTNDSWCDVLIKDQKVISLCKGKANPKPVIAIRPFEGSALGMADPWYNALFLFYGEASQEGRPVWPVPFESLFERYGLKRIEKVASGEGETVVARLKIGKSERSYWFSPRHNFLIKKVEAKADGRSTICEVPSFKEVAPGVFFPELKVSKSYDVDGKLDRTTATFADIRANMPLANEIFALNLSPHTEVHDFIQGKKFGTDATGRVTGAGVDLPTPPPLSASGKPIVSRTETKSEPGSWIDWILPASLSVLAVAGGAWWVQRRRAKWRSN